jgi:NADH-quinone oxidoreductase subunit C
MADEENKGQPESKQPQTSPAAGEDKKPAEEKAAADAPPTEGAKGPTPATPPESPKPTPPKAAAKPAPKPPARKPPPKPEPLDNEFIRRLRDRFGNEIGEATIDRQQAIVVVKGSRLRDLARYLRDDEQFNLLEDLTAVDWYDRRPRFDVLLNLYSFEKHERVRIKAQVDDTCPSVARIWTTANWLERECFDMFGLQFEGHPDLKRILLPDEWEGHPLRKDYDILKQDENWVRENLGIESGQ